MDARSWPVLFALTAAHVLCASAGCGRMGGNYPPPTPAPRDAISWKAELSASAYRWRGDCEGPNSVWLDVELRLYPDGTGDVASLERATGQSVAILGVVGPIRWDVVGGDASQGLLSLTDSSGAVRSFELTWGSGGPWDFIGLKSDGEVIKLRRNR